MNQWPLFDLTVNVVDFPGTEVLLKIFPFSTPYSSRIQLNSKYIFEIICNKNNKIEKKSNIRPDLVS